MKENIKTVILITLILILSFFLVKTNRTRQVKQEKPETVYLSDTITNVVYDTVFLTKYKTVKLPTDTLIITNDSIRVDSVFVEIPIYSYQLDTTFTTDTTQLKLSIKNSGYDVKLDTLSYHFEYTPTPKKTNFFKEHFKFGVGVSTGIGVFQKKPDVFVGVGFYYVF